MCMFVSETSPVGHNRIGPRKALSARCQGSLPDFVTAMMQPANQLLYLLYGKKPAYRYEAKFSILTALARHDKPNGFVIRLMTDDPQAFEGWPVDIIPLDSITLDKWAGNFGYVHRRKACAIALAAGWAEKTVFIDCDTLFLAAPGSLFGKVGPGRYLVDEFEWHWKEAVTRPAYSQLATALEASGQRPPDELRLYNSGLCGISRQDAPLIEEVIARIDQWGEHASRLHTVEQIALSFALRDRVVSEGRGIIHHYYAQKAFFHAMQEVFFARYGEDFSRKLVSLSREVPRQRPCPSVLRRLQIKWRLKGVNPELRQIGKKLMYGSFLPSSGYAQACRDVWWDSARRDLLRAQGYDLSRGWPAQLPRAGKGSESQFESFLRRFPCQ